MGYADGVKGYRSWDPTACKFIVSRDVIFAYSTIKKMATVQINKKYGENNSSEVEPKHEEQVPDEANEIEVWRSTCQIRSSSCQTRPSPWYSYYALVSHNAYWFLAEEGELLTYQEALNSPNTFLWMTIMQEKMEALYRN